MKKIISILLAMLMMFSLVTVAFAETDLPAEGTDTEETTPAPEAPEAGNESIIPDLGEFNWILDLPFWTVGPALKFAKIALKLVSVYLKVAKIFGFVEKDMDDYIIDIIEDMIKNAQNNGTAEEETTAPETATTAPAAA